MLLSGVYIVNSALYNKVKGGSQLSIKDVGISFAKRFAKVCEWNENIFNCFR